MIREKHLSHTLGDENKLIRRLFRPAPREDGLDTAVSGEFYVGLGDQFDDDRRRVREAV
jgi:hypothetical protein